jgi:nicotinate-nucleotide adenylyltransferase
MHTLLYGGTFDPIHHGHLITCQRARELRHADRVLLIPARVSPHKTHGATGSASAEDRLAMLELAIDGLPGFAVDGRELQRPGPSYTIDTIEELRREQNGKGRHFTLLLGMDQLPKLHSWRRAGDLLNPDKTSNPLGLAILLRSDPNASHALDAEIEEGLRAIEKSLGKGARDHVARSFLGTPRIDISATDIRDRVRRGLPIDFLVPPAVAAYIREHGLYRA